MCPIFALLKSQSPGLPKFICQFIQFAVSQEDGEHWLQAWSWLAADATFQHVASHSPLQHEAVSVEPGVGGLHRQSIS